MQECTLDTKVIVIFSYYVPLFLSKLQMGQYNNLVVRAVQCTSCLTVVGLHPNFNESGHALTSSSKLLTKANKPK